MADVMIRICGTQHAPASEGDHSPEKIQTESSAQGTYYERNGAHYLLWEERLEGVDTPVQSRLKYRDGCLEMTRRGGMNSHMVFETGKTYCTDYATPIGTLRMDIATDSVTMEEDADGTRHVTACYRFCQDGETTLHCEVSVEIREIRS